MSTLEYVACSTSMASALAAEVTFRELAFERTEFASVHGNHINHIVTPGRTPDPGHCRTRINERPTRPLSGTTRSLPVSKGNCPTPLRYYLPLRTKPIPQPA